MCKSSPTSFWPTHSKSLHDEIVDIVCTAVAECVGSRALEYIRSRRGSVIPGHWQSSSDFVSSCSKDIFHWAGLTHLRSGKDGGRSRKRKTTYDQLNVTLISEMGVVKQRSYAHPRELAESVVLALAESRREGLLAGTCVNYNDGSILLCTQVHLQWHALFERLPCLDCGSFLKGIRGLRMHQMLVHGVEYETAQREATESRYDVFDDSFLHNAIGPSASFISLNMLPFHPLFD